MKIMLKNLSIFISGLHIRKYSILKNKSGQTLVEYGILLMLIAMVVISAVTFVGQKTSTMYNTISTKLPGT